MPAEGPSTTVGSCSRINRLRARGSWLRLPGDERGAVLIYVTAILGVVLAFGALVIDGGRLASLQSELQAFADHTALAAAGELDGRPGAIARATAAAGLITADRQTFGAGAAALDPATDLVLRFLSSLPASDDDPISTTSVTTSDAQAVYAEVTVTPRTLSLWLIPGAAGLFGFETGATGTTGATAVAGFTQHVCDAAPLMFCSPSGPSYTPVRGRMIQLKSQNFWGPGAFGLLDGNFDPSGPCGAANQGADFYRCVVAAVRNVTRSVARRGVDIRPGQVTGAAAAGFNTRFDIYGTNLHSKRNDPLFAPAPNVVRGFGPGSGGQCISGNIAAYAQFRPIAARFLFRDKQLRARQHLRQRGVGQGRLLVPQSRGRSPFGRYPLRALPGGDQRGAERQSDPPRTARGNRPAALQQRSARRARPARAGERCRRLRQSAARQRRECAGARLRAGLPDRAGRARCQRQQLQHLGGGDRRAPTCRCRQFRVGHSP